MALQFRPTSKVDLILEQIKEEVPPEDLVCPDCGSGIHLRCAYRLSMVGP